MFTSVPHTASPGIAYSGLQLPTFFAIGCGAVAGRGNHMPQCSARMPEAGPWYHATWASWLAHPLAPT